MFDCGGRTTKTVLMLMMGTCVSNLVVWPSGLRRCVKAVRTPPPSDVCRSLKGFILARRRSCFFCVFGLGLVFSGKVGFCVDSVKFWNFVLLSQGWLNKKGAKHNSVKGCRLLCNVPCGSQLTWGPVA